MTGFSEGEAVAVEPTLFCGRCAECRAGLTNLCPSLGFHGLSGGGGGYVDGTPKVEHSISFVRGCP
jgi:(R,R)-butanediol dehydrogenase/meso-butanediol dehydrogenase/diacetyl reductase